MSKIPPAMKQNGRHANPSFPKTEYLYRRVPIDFWPDASEPLDVNAIELPDLSCGRSRYGHPEWLRLDLHRQDLGNWGVIGFQVGDIPVDRWLEGVFQFTFKTFHDPEEWNFPHSEVRAFDDDEHIDLLEKLPEVVHLEWRELLLRKVTTFLKPKQTAKIRDTAPASHVPELPIPSS
jgi:hypothetical protein